MYGADANAVYCQSAGAAGDRDLGSEWELLQCLCESVKLCGDYATWPERRGRVQMVWPYIGSREQHLVLPDIHDQFDH
jgi:hypothetical protein